MQVNSQFRAFCAIYYKTKYNKQRKSLIDGQRLTVI